MKRHRSHFGWAAACCLLLAITGCKKSNQFVAPPPPKVNVAKPVAEKITRYLEATGNTAAVASVDLVARVQGFVQDISYTDGAMVKKGDILFTIEPLPYQAKLQQAQAAEASAQAQLTNAAATFNRQEALQRQSVASVQNLDDARGQRDTAQANLAQAQANTQIAAINYSYTRVLAPFDGRVSAHLVSIGDLVGTSPTKLATIVQMRPMHVNFSVSETDVLRIRAEALRRGQQAEAITAVPRSACKARPDIRIAAIWIMPRRWWTRAPARWRCAACWRTPTWCCCPATSPAFGFPWRRPMHCWCRMRRWAPIRVGVMCWWWVRTRLSHSATSPPDPWKGPCG
jgi:multidrug efflux pump subunit AcrA (membrane-fusion protein)